MSQNTLYGIVVALRDQLQAQISGSGDYNYNLRANQIELGFYFPDEADADPYVCIADAAENYQSSTIDDGFKVPIEITLFGYAKSKATDRSFQEILKLLSDVENALLADTTIGSRVQGLEFATEVGATNEFKIGVFSVTITASYEI